MGGLIAAAEGLDGVAWLGLLVAAVAAAAQLRTPSGAGCCVLRCVYEGLRVVAACLQELLWWIEARAGPVVGLMC